MLTRPITGTLDNKNKNMKHNTKYKIKPLGSKVAKYVTCGAETLEAGAADLVTRMLGAIVHVPDESRFLGDTEDGTAFIEAKRINAVRIGYIGGKTERYIQIALSPAENCDGDPQIALRISGQQLTQLKKSIALLD
jgi:hypothetical protein